MTEPDETDLMAVPAEDASVRPGLKGPKIQSSLERMRFELPRKAEPPDLAKLRQQAIVRTARLGGKAFQGGEAFRAQRDVDHLPPAESQSPASAEVLNRRQFKLSLGPFEEFLWRDGIHEFLENIGVGATPRLV